MTRRYRKSSNYQPTLKPNTVSIPAILSEDRSSIVLSDGSKWVCVEYRGNNSMFVKEGKLKPEQKVVSLGEEFGVMENTVSHIPIKCKLERLKILIEKRGGRYGQ